MQDYSWAVQWMSVGMLAFLLVRSAWLNHTVTKAKDQDALEKKWKP